MRDVRLGLVVLAVLAVAGCGVPPSRTGPERLTGVVQVFAPTSFTDLLPQMVHQFQTEQPGLDVRLRFSADSESTRLAAAAADASVLIVEGPDTAAGLHLADNQMVIAVATGNPQGIADLAGLARPGVRVVICAADEPCGAVSAAVLSAAGVTLPGAMRVLDVRSALGQVEQGAADAALVYRTDTRAVQGTIDTVEFGQSRAALASYHACVPAGHPNAAAAQAFLSFLGSASTRDLLTAAGFQLPA